MAETARMYEMGENATAIRAIFEMRERANIYAPTGKYDKRKHQEETYTLEQIMAKLNITQAELDQMPDVELEY